MPRNDFPAAATELRRNPRTWVITGVAGFIGSNLLQQLLALGQDVVGLDNFATGYRRNLEDARRATPGGRFRLVEGDVRDLDACMGVCAGADFVLHQAALASVPRSLDDPAGVDAVNVGGTINVLVAAREAGVRRVVYASSSAVYGNVQRVPVCETDVGEPLSPYALGKRVTEDYAALFGRLYGLETVGLRYFNVFGPRQDPRSAYAAVIPRWTQALLEGDPCRIFGDGQTTRDFVSVGDVARANILAATAVVPGGGARVFNVGGGQPISLETLYRTLAAEVVRVTGRAAGPCIHQPFREGDVRHSGADITRIHEVLGFSPVDRLAPALGATVAWHAGAVAEPPLARSA